MGRPLPSCPGVVPVCAEGSWGIKNEVGEDWTLAGCNIFQVGGKLESKQRRKARGKQMQKARGKQMQKEQAENETPPKQTFFFSCPTKTDMIEAEHEVETEFEANWKFQVLRAFVRCIPPPSTDHLQNKRDLDINQTHHPTPHPPHPPQPPQPWPSQASCPPSAPTSSTPSPSTPSSPPSNP